MPYLEATILESLRWNPSAGAGVPHLPVVDDFFQGYFIPKERLLSKTHDWQRYPLLPQPNFLPSGTLPDGGRNPAALYSNPDVLSPWDWAFGFGCRICPGRDLAMQGGWISAVLVLWALEIKPNYGRTMANDYKATDEERFDFGFLA
ncbi:hypothetical protein FRC00_006069 [Tulasnella sp. 408]|nr:hypothetical protein FRC00_006069 [Tulasnella sp. 408]